MDNLNAVCAPYIIRREDSCSVMLEKGLVLVSKVLEGGAVGCEGASTLFY